MNTPHTPKRLIVLAMLTEAFDITLRNGVALGKLKALGVPSEMAITMIPPANHNFDKITPEGAIHFLAIVEDNARDFVKELEIQYGPMDQYISHAPEIAAESNYGPLVDRIMEYLVPDEAKVEAFLSTIGKGAV